MKKRLLLLLCAMLFLAGGVGFAQSVTVSGKISGDGVPLPGVSILVKGENTGTTTDAYGEFRLSTAPDAVLVISFIGYKTKEVPVNGRTYISETLDVEVSQLGEVVVLGYQTSAKR